MATPAGLEPATNCLDYALEDSHFTGLSYPQAKAVALSIELRNRNISGTPEGTRTPIFHPVTLYGVEIRDDTEAYCS